MVRHLGNAVPEALALLDGEEGVAVVGVALLEAGIVDVLQEGCQRVASLSSHIVLGQRILLEQLNTSLDLLLRNELLDWHGWSSTSLAALVEVLIALQLLVLSWLCLVINVHFFDISFFLFI